MMQKKRPMWLRNGFPAGKKLHDIKMMLRKAGLHSVCEEAMCPNIAECFSKKTATFLILGKVCTRNCGYCNVMHATAVNKPMSVDKDEPERVAKAVRKLGISYVVITSVTRDDLPDYGSLMFAKTITEIRKTSPKTRIEVLVPDFSGSADALKAVVREMPDVISHNIETVAELFPKARPGGDFQRSIMLLSLIKKLSPRQKTKSGLMLGLGESTKMIYSALKQLRKAKVDFLSIGQYLQPSKANLTVKKYYAPAEFEKIRKKASSLGFLHVEAGPMVRSSYNAEKLKKLLK
jgi:lipoyl synthase